MREVIILAGGLGTRLRDAVPDLPKCMAPVAGVPFLQHVIRYLLEQGLQKFIFSLGYKHEVIEEFLNDQFSTLNFQCVIEHEPLGTGGAIRLACEKATEENVLIVNGDTIFKADVRSLASVHELTNADCTIALKMMQNFDRYGVVEMDEDNRIKSFKEKQFYQEGLINGGTYILKVQSLLKLDLPEKFSFEKDYLEKKSSGLYGSLQQGYFIDIGIPEDYERAQTELKHTPFQLNEINGDWTIFLDRDGVINYERDNDYIYNWDEFRFYPGVPEAIALLAQRFGLVIVVSNQRGVERGLMTEENLQQIHINMKNHIEENGGRIDKIYYCIAKDPKNFSRKPNPGMALLAYADFPDIEPSKTIMVGNKLSDMVFGRNAGTHTVYVKTTHPNQVLPHPDIDYVYENLLEFAKTIG